jgi:hypothetical protein
MNTVVEDVNEDQAGGHSLSLADASSVKSSGGYYTESVSKFSLANSETNRINRSKFALFLVILTVAITSSFLTFQLVTNQEQQEYETKVSRSE